MSGDQIEKNMVWKFKGDNCGVAPDAKEADRVAVFLSIRKKNFMPHRNDGEFNDRFSLYFAQPIALCRIAKVIL